MSPEPQPDLAELNERDLLVDRAQGLLYVVAATFFAFGLRFSFGGAPVTGSINLATGVVFVVLGRAFIRRCETVQSARRLVHVAFFFCVADLVAVCMIGGQGAAFGVWFLAAFPVFGAYLLGNRAALAWATVCALTAVGIHASESFIRIDPEVLPTPIDVTFARVVLIAAVTGFAMVSRRNNDLHMETLVWRKRQLDGQAEDLRLARDRALAAVRTRDQFLANMSHELRTPFNAFMGMAQMLLTTELGEDQRRMVSVIHESGQSLLRLVDDVLDVARIAQGQEDLVLAPVDLRRLLEDIVTVHAFSKRASGVDVAAWLAPGTARYVRVDSDRLRQILSNLVGNALKFTHDGSVSLRAYQTERHYCIEVKDTGIGIAEEQLEEIFEAFHQVDASSTREFGGAGLGLHLSRQLAEAMGGTLTVTSRSGHGSTFTLRLPGTIPTDDVAPDTTRVPDAHVAVVGLRPASRLAVGTHLVALGGRMTHFDVMPKGVPQSRPTVVLLGPEVADGCPEWADEIPVYRAQRPGETPRDSATSRRICAWPITFDGVAQMLTSAPHDRVSAPVAAARGSRKALSSLDILVAEDDVTNQEVLRLMLGHLGLEVTVVGSGEAAIVALEEQSYDVVLSDLLMPGMDGLELARRLSARPTPPGLVAITANVLPEHRRACEEAGFDAVVAKPVELEILRTTLMRWTDADASAEEEAAHDRSALGMLRRLAKTPERFASMIERHLRSLRERLDELDRAIDAKDDEAFVMAAHSIKGSAATFGQTRLSNEAARLEQLAVGRGVSAIQASFGGEDPLSSIRAAVADTRAQLEREARTRPSPGASPARNQSAET